MFVVVCGDDAPLVWEGIEPMVVDIDRRTRSVDPVGMERAITRRTAGIVATHDGMPCHVAAFRGIDAARGLRVIAGATAGTD